MTKVCYWDPETQSQKERDMTLEEEAQRLADIATATTPVVPDSIAMWQAREEMLDTVIGNSTLLDLVYAYFNSLPSPVKEKAISKFEFSSTMRRDDSLLVSVAPTLGLTPTQIATMFLSASKRV